jgi:hypothetical protein
MATQINLVPVTTSAAWRGDELAKGGDWIYHLDGGQIQELETLGAQLVNDDPDLRRITLDDYPLERCLPAVADWKQRMETGHGFVLVRGLRTQLYSDALSAAIYYVLGLHIGEPMRQNELGDLIDHIYATSDKKLEDPDALSKSIRDKLPFHSDSSDVVALMCLRPSMDGGASCLVSGAGIYNEILARRPDLAPLLFEPFHWDWRRQDPAAPRNTYTSPIISIVDGVFSMYAGSLYILTAQDYPEVPRLTEQQRELLTLFEDITYEPGMAIEMDFRPGDIQWLSNHAALHSRTEFTDYPEPQRRRHLLRLWLHLREPRPITAGFGKSVVQSRASHRDEQADDSQGNFRIVQAAVPRIIT